MRLSNIDTQFLKVCGDDNNHHFADHQLMTIQLAGHASCSCPVAKGHPLVGASPYNMETGAGAAGPLAPLRHWQHASCGCDAAAGELAYSDMCSEYYPSAWEAEFVLVHCKTNFPSTLVLSSMWLIGFMAATSRCTIAIVMPAEA